MPAQKNPREQNKSTCVWVLASGPYDDLPSALQWAPKAGKVVAADGGTALARELGLRPDLIVGDLDSSPPSLVEQFQAQGVEVRRYDHDTKLETDTELALLAALEWQPDTIVLLGALGGRLDHALANVLLLTRHAFAPLDIRILDGKQEAYIAKAGPVEPYSRQQGRHYHTASHRRGRHWRAHRRPPLALAWRDFTSRAWPGGKQSD